MDRLPFDFVTTWIIGEKEIFDVNDINEANEDYNSLQRLKDLSSLDIAMCYDPSFFVFIE